MPEVLQVVRLLQQVPLFRNLAAVDLMAVGQAAQYREVERGRCFFEHGDPADTLYVLHRGQVKLTQATPDGGPVVLRFVGPGEVFGRTALLANQQYALSARAVRWSKALAWRSDAIIHLMQKQPCIALNAVGDLIAELAELRARYRELATERVERRIARALLRLAERTGYQTDDRLLIDMPLSRQDLAELTGTTLFTVSRILRLWERAGLVEVGRQRVAIINHEGVLAVAGDVSEKAGLRASR